MIIELNGKDYKHDLLKKRKCCICGKKYSESDLEDCQLKEKHGGNIYVTTYILPHGRICKKCISELKEVV